LNNERSVIITLQQRILSKETGRRLVMGGVMLLVIGFIFLIGYPNQTSYRMAGIVGAIELFVGLVMYQTLDNPK